jgi:hypothetical protein
MVVTAIPAAWNGPPAPLPGPKRLHAAASPA